MQHEFFMDGDTLMVSMHCDDSTVVTRPATKEEEAGYTTQEGPEPAVRAPRKAKK